MAADAALVVVDGVAGVEVQTEKVWDFANDFKLPRAIVINKLDRERAELRARPGKRPVQFFGRTAVPIQLPIGAERDFKGVVDLVRMKAYTYTPDGDGKGKEGEIPADLADAAQKAHEALVEMVAEGNDAFMEEFFEKGTLPPGAHARGSALRRARDAHLPGAVRFGAAQYRHGSDSEFHRREFCPRPRRREGMPATAERQGSRAQKVTESGPCSAFVFKTIADPFAGRISYFKVISGVLKNDANLINVAQGRERAAVAHRLAAWARRSRR